MILIVLIKKNKETIQAKSSFVNPITIHVASSSLNYQSNQDVLSR